MRHGTILTKTINGVRYTTSISRGKFDYQGSAIPDLYGSVP
jgi:hypothetical protein